MTSEEFAMMVILSSLTCVAIFLAFGDLSAGFLSALLVVSFYTALGIRSIDTSLHHLIRLLSDPDGNVRTELKGTLQRLWHYWRELARELG